MDHFCLRALAISLAMVLLGAGAPASADSPSQRARVTREADAGLARASRAGRSLLALLDQSRRARDLPRIACVDRTLSRVNSFGRQLASRRQRLHHLSDRRELTRERVVIRSLVRQLQQAEREGRACVNPALRRVSATSRTEVEVTIDGTVPDEGDLRPDRPRRW